jgi:hypothetical protein
MITVNKMRRSVNLILVITYLRYKSTKDLKLKLQIHRMETFAKKNQYQVN